MKLLSTILSTWQVLFEKRALVVGILILPAMLTFLAGVGYDHNSVLPLTIGVHRTASTPIGMSVLADLENDGYQIVRYKHETLCIDRVRQGKIHTCMVLSQQMGKERAVFYVNPSDMALAEHMKNVVHGATTTEITENNTRQLLAEVGSAREAASQIRPIIVDLTTNYQKITNEVDSFVLGLRKQTAPVNLTALTKNDTVNGSSTEVLRFVDGLGRTKSDMVGSYDDAYNDVKSMLDDMAINEGDKADIMLRLNQGKQEIHDLSEQFSDNVFLTRARSDKLGGALEDLANQLDIIQQDIDNFNKLKMESGIRAKKIKDHVDKTLLDVAAVQRNLNIIGAAVLDIEGDDPSQVLSPLDASVGTVQGEGTPFDYVFPNVLMLFILVAGLSLGAITHIHFHDSPGARRSRLSPTAEHLTLAGQHLGVWSLVGAIGVIMSLTAQAFLPLNYNTLPILMMAVLGTSFVSVLMGSWIGHLSGREESALVWSMGVSAGAVLMSPMLQPIEALPELMRIVAQSNPLTLGLQVARSAIGGAANWEAMILLGMASLCLWTVLLAHSRWNR